MRHTVRYSFCCDLDALGWSLILKDMNGNDSKHR